MIQLDKLKAIKHLVTHANCPDGVMTAYIVKQVLPNVKITFLTHKTKAYADLEPEEGMLFCDIVPSKDKLQAFIDAGTIVLDHHIKVKHIVDAFGDNGVFAHEENDPGVSGALLAYRHVYFPLADQEVSLKNKTYAYRIEEFATLAGIVDTCVRDSPHWEAACHQAEAMTFWPVEEILSTPSCRFSDLIPIGKVIYERNINGAKDLIENAYRFISLKGTRVIIFNSTGITSDVSDLCDDVDLVVGFKYKAEDRNPIIIFSTRSHTDFDCGTFCEFWGGGGHTKAAGFSVPVIIKRENNPLEMFYNILNIYETKTKATLEDSAS